MGKIHFTPKDILQKDFKQKIRGYDPTDVDSFLDMVIRDYETFNKSIHQLQNENDQLRNKIDQLSQNGGTGMSLDSDEDTHTSPTPQQPMGELSHSNNATIINILKRLSNLENHVFGPQMGQKSNHDQF